MENKPPTKTRPKLTNKEESMVLILFGADQGLDLIWDRNPFNY